jgi:hypothetical protein
LSSDLCRIRQGIDHVVEGRKDGRQDDICRKASPVCLNTKA